MADSNIRHAVARSTGATTWTRKDGDEWTATCLNHGTVTTAPNRGKAWTTGSHPEDWCPKCKAIAAGKGDKVTGDRLEIPAAKPTPKAAPKKAAAKALPAPNATAKKAS